MSSISIHRIRLKGPWEVASSLFGNMGDSHQPIRTDGQRSRHSAPVADVVPSQVQRIQVPVAWRDLFGSQAGEALFRRRFHTPTNLQSSDRIVIRLPHGCGEIRHLTVNAAEISQNEEDCWSFDVTEHLQPFNMLQFMLHFDPAVMPDRAGGLWEAALLEIHSSTPDDAVADS